MSRPRILDLFSGAGGAAKGYQRAGFYVVGVDIEPQPNYAGDEFHQADALTFPLDGFDAIHASPPCQMYSRAMRHLASEKPMLIDVIKGRLAATGMPWVIENVEGAPLPRQSDLLGRHGAMLCGTSFGLRVYRHRLFEASFPIGGLPCSHVRPAMNPHNSVARDEMWEEFGRTDPVELHWRREMGVEWMNRHEARESVPPVFAEYLGGLLMEHITRSALGKVA